jgi:membrane protein DedA with SNARE-associated domain
MRFQIANVVSAIVWLPALMVPGAIAGTFLNDVANFGEKAFGYVFIGFVIFPLAVAFVAWLCKRKRA